MQMIKLYLGLNDNRQALYGDFAACAEEGGRCLFLVPEQFTVHAEQRLLSILGHGMGEDAEVISFKRLCSRILSACPRGARRALDAAGRAVMMERAVRLSASQLDIFASVQPGVNFITRLTELNAELARCAVTPAALEAAAAGIASQQKSRRLCELAYLLGTYNSLLESSGEETGTDLELAARALADTEVFSGYHIFIDGFFVFSEQEYALLARIADRCDMTVSLPCDGIADDEGGYGVFSDIKKCARRFMKMGELTGVPVRLQVFDGDAYHAAPPLSHLTRSLFSRTGAPFDGAVGALRCYAAGDVNGEAQYAAARIKELVRDGYRYSDIAVLFRQQDRYGATLDSVFAQHGIPAFADRRAEMMTKPLVLYVSTALDIALRRFNTDDVFTHIKTGLTCLDDEQIKELSRYCRMWEILPGSWLGRAFTNNPEGFDRPFDADARARLHEINVIRDEVIAPIKRLAGALKGSAGEMCAAVYAYLCETDMRARLERQAQACRESGRDALAQETAQTWGVFIGALDAVAAAAGEEQVSPERFRNMLMCALSVCDIGHIPTSRDEVLVGSVDRVKTTGKRAVIVLGLNDGAFPLNITDLSLISDAERELLHKAGLELEPGADDRMFRERFFAWYAFSLPSERLYLTCCAADSDGAAAQPSYFYTHVLNLFPALVPDPDPDLMQDRQFAFSALADGGCTDKGLCEYFEKTDYAPRLEAVRRLRSFGLEDKAVSRRQTAALGGSGLSMSPTRADTYFTCRFKHYCRYMLGLKAPVRGDVNAVNTGTFIHHALETILREVMQDAARPLWEIPRGEMLERIRTVTDSFLNDYLGGGENKSSRYIYLFERLSDIIVTLITSLGEEFRLSSFRPADFEIRIGDGGEVESLNIDFDGGRVSLSGTADRVDVYTDARDGQTYVRVVDYKSGRKKFSMSDVYNGLSTQMLVYLFSLCAGGHGRYGSEAKPAGVLYNRADDLLCSVSRSDTPESVENKKRTMRVQNGLLLNDMDVLRAMEAELGGRFIGVKAKSDGSLRDVGCVTSPEGFGRIRERIEELFRGMGRTLLDGDITADPLDSAADSCDRCDYRSVCGFEPRRRKYRAREKFTGSSLDKSVKGAENDA